MLLDDSRSDEKPTIEVTKEVVGAPAQEKDIQESLMIAKMTLEERDNAKNDATLNSKNQHSTGGQSQVNNDELLRLQSIMTLVARYSSRASDVEDED